MRVVAIVVVMVAISARLAAQAPVVFEGGVVNGASFRPSSAPASAVAPGSIISIFGTNLAPGSGSAISLPLPEEINGTRVRVGGLAARLFFVSTGQINAQLPWAMPAGAAQLTVETPQGTSASVAVVVAASAPGLFSQASSGRGPGAILNFVSESSTPLNTATVTSPPGGIVIIYGTGFGPVAPTPADGAAAAGNEVTITQPVVTIGGRAASVQYSGLAPGFAGLYQINAVAPSGTPDGCFLPVAVTFGPATSNAVSNMVTIAVMASRGNCNAAATGTPAGFLNGSVGFAYLSRETTQFATPPPSPQRPPPDNFSAAFVRFESDLGAAATAGAVFPPVGGGCIAEVFRFDANAGSPFANLRFRALNAGVLNVSGPFFGSPFNVPFDARSGFYSTDLAAGTLLPGLYTLSGTGGAEVGAFSATLNVAPLFQVTSFGTSGATFSQSQPLRIAWDCPDLTGQVGISIRSIDRARLLAGAINCCVACRGGQATLSPELLSQIPVSETAGARIDVSFSPVDGVARIITTPLNFGFFSYVMDSSLARLTLVR